MAQALNIRHAGIVVSDLDRSLGFYRDLLGLEVQRQMTESGPCLEAVLALEGVQVETVKLAPKGEATQVELLKFESHLISRYDGDRTLLTGPTHVAFSVSDLVMLHEKMVAAGVEFNTAPVLSSDGKVLLTYCKDPDGTLIELVEVL